MRARPDNFCSTRPPIEALAASTEIERFIVEVDEALDLAAGVPRLVPAVPAPLANSDANVSRSSKLNAPALSENTPTGPDGSGIVPVTSTVGLSAAGLKLRRLKAAPGGTISIAPWSVC